MEDNLSWLDDVEDALNMLAREFIPTAEQQRAFKRDMERLWEVYLVWHGLKAAPCHGGQRERRRKHGGRWPKLQRAKRVRPVWLHGR